MNTCDCEDPPGGRVTCPEGHHAVCRVRRGEAQGFCLSPPAQAVGLELAAWFCSQLLEREVTAGEVMASPQLQAALADGRFVNHDTGDVFTFSFPETLPTMMAAPAPIFLTT
jgi:hypothetical protein